MSYDQDRRDFILGVVAAAFAVSLTPGSATAAGRTIAEQRWALWDKSQKPVRGGIFRIAAELYVGKMNPHHWPVNDWVTLTYIFDRLMYTDGQYKPTVSFVAEELRLENPQTLVMRIRPDITFHDGSKLDAAAIKWLIDWIRDPKSNAWDAGWLAPLETVEMVDDLTLRWTFKTPWAAFDGVVANVPGYLLSAAALKADPEKFDSQPVGSGPYMLEEASPDNFLKLKRNPNWWFAKASGNPDMPYFDGIHVSIVPDPAVRLANLRAGKIDALMLDKSQYAPLKGDANFNIYRFPQNGLAGMRFNCTRGAFQDIRLRKAVSHAIDRKALIAGTQFGLARVASCMFPSDHWCHNPDLLPVAYDPALSKELLAESGHGDRLKVRGYWINTAMGQTVAEAIKSMLAKVGITWEVELLAAAARAQRMKDLDYELALGGWPWIYDPDLMPTGLYHPDGGFNFGRSTNNAAIALIEAGRREVDGEKRRNIYWQLEKILYDSYEDVWLWWEEVAVAFNKKVLGWDQENFLTWRDVWFWSHPLWFKDGKA